MMAIEPTDADIGRQVVYHHHGIERFDEGEITSFNEAYVFVRYRGDNFSKATKRVDLHWSHPTEPLSQEDEK